MRLGYDVDLSDFRLDGVLEECFCEHVISEHLLVLEAIGFWDEVHKNCHIGDAREGATEHVAFPTDKNSRYDPNGTYSEDDVGVALKVKYPEQGRWCFGVALRRPYDKASDPEGMRLKLFDYTTKKFWASLNGIRNDTGRTNA